MLGVFGDINSETPVETLSVLCFIAQTAEKIERLRQELADLEEVLRAILDVKNCSWQEFEEIRTSKVNKRGAFENKIFLESVK